ncbi:putative secreted protein (Por secretion system target) [Gelidibacter algens]|uniref:Putative secreted protein (Por secretion system target) n=1 Tax=Gelidibacter algens TaxID=49280 RepID=A0A1A7R0T5_9FLAO|nr:T9SS type A sorting domain-containing protein [Gelidibacter algens]OBX25133.1 hypothetical protein A9996_11550 [Gelidibacter algens]RAJ20021.1 putative secreted protein (Por secretion system target) [Gelidibacter algens]
MKPLFYILTTILFLSSPKLTAQTTDVITELNSPRSMAVHGNDLYIVETLADKIIKIDITATIPTATDVVTALDGPLAIVINGNDLYIAEFSGNKVSKIDIAEPTPMVTDVITGLSGPVALLINGNDLYITEYTDSKVSKIDLSTLSLNDAVTNNSIRVYPNPSTDFITISGLTEDKNFKIYSAIGSEIEKGVIKNEGEINTQGLAKGMYVLKFDDGNSLKFIKE